MKVWGLNGIHVRNRKLLKAGRNVGPGGRFPGFITNSYRGKGNHAVSELA